jgi:hypothetical protein
MEVDIARMALEQRPTLLDEISLLKNQSAASASARLYGER